MNKKMIQGYLFVILSAVLYGCMPMMAKFIYREGVNPQSLVFLRSALSLPFLVFLSFVTAKRILIPKKALPRIGVIALMGGSVTPLLLYISYNFIDSGTATVFHFVYPAVVVLFGILFFKKKTNLPTLLSVFLCIFGIALFYDPSQTMDWKGSAIALVSGVTYAVYVVMVSAFPYKKIAGFLFGFYTSLFSSIFLLAFCLVTDQLILPKTLSGWGLCLLFAITLNVGAAILFQQGTFIIGGERSSVLSAMEPITSIFAGVLVFGEKMTPFTVLGAVIVIGAGVFIALFDSKKEKEKEAKE